MVLNSTSGRTVKLVFEVDISLKKHYISDVS
jgi:hypothetical protein